MTSFLSLFGIIVWQCSITFSFCHVIFLGIVSDIDFCPGGIEIVRLALSHVSVVWGGVGHVAPQIVAPAIFVAGAKLCR